MTEFQHGEMVCNTGELFYSFDQYMIEIPKL